MAYFETHVVDGHNSVSLQGFTLSYVDRIVVGCDLILNLSWSDVLLSCKVTWVLMLIQ